MPYRSHGFNPTDEHIAKEGYKAFPPKGKPIHPNSAEEKRLMAAVTPMQATGDKDELAREAVEVANYWPHHPMALMMAAYGYTWDDDDDTGPGDPGWLV